MNDIESSEPVAEHSNMNRHSGDYHNTNTCDDNTGTCSSSSAVGPVNVAKDLYPYCIVWSPLPPITWVLPFIGHMGIADSRGIIHDFAGPYYIGVGNFAFGAPTRYLQLDPALCHSLGWDEGVASGCQEYKKHNHNICFDNCHSHVARCLNDMRYNNISTYNMVDLGVRMFFMGSFTSVGGFLKTFLPFTIWMFLLLFFTRK